MPSPYDDPSLWTPHAARRGAHRQRRRASPWPYLAVLIVAAAAVVVTLSLIGVSP